MYVVDSHITPVIAKYIEHLTTELVYQVAVIFPANQRLRT